ncbi:nitrate reductase [Actinopolyspora erythraea]|uniref:Nitrate reductase n=1 Tax=Actinopolyspora erythraea TaxID=414996 RepID=A0A099D8V6_9ACTN|nr:solute carrier family 23 protein [Actinopolyspora erythraea]ASU78216.1 nitrate reductase [Actinopolyspora erythraea]KGI81840.1 nitrate reductase [Actinopolyspora erythraea]
MALWAVHGNGRQPPDGEDVATEERLSWPLTMGLGLQHLLAMFGATVLVPRLTGLPVATTLLASGAGTLLFLLLTRNRVPAYLGASVTFVMPLGAAAERSGAGPGGMVGAILVVGLLVTAIGIAVKALGVRLLETAMPPVVTGGVIVLVGLGMATHSVTLFGKAAHDVPSFEPVPLAAVITALVIVLSALLGRGLLSRGCVLFGIAAGWLYAVATGGIHQVRVESLRTAPWFGVPDLVAPQLHISVVPVVLPLVIVLAAQQVGVVKAVAATTGRDLDGNVGDALIGGGMATTLSGSVGGGGLIGYAENMGVMAASRVFSTAACMTAALGAVLLAFSPKFVALLDTVPIGVVGAATIVLLGMVTLIGVRLWLRARVDFTDPLDLGVVVTTSLVGVTNPTLSLGGVRLSGVVWGSLLLVLAYPLLRTLVDELRGRSRE